MGFFSYYWLMGITENGMEWHVTYYAYYNAFRFFAQTEANTVRMCIVHIHCIQKRVQTMDTKEEEHDQWMGMKETENVSTIATKRNKKSTKCVFTILLKKKQIMHATQCEKKKKKSWKILKMKRKIPCLSGIVIAK